MPSDLEITSRMPAARASVRSWALTCIVNITKATLGARQRNLTSRLKAVHDRHRKIQNHQIGAKFGHLLQGNFSRFQPRRIPATRCSARWTLGASLGLRNCRPRLVF